MNIFPRDHMQAAACSASFSDVPPSFQVCMNTRIRTFALSSGCPPPKNLWINDATAFWSTDGAAACDSCDCDGDCGCGMLPGWMVSFGADAPAAFASLAIESADGLSRKCFFATTRAAITATKPANLRKSFTVRPPFAYA